MIKHQYSVLVDDILFNGNYQIEEDKGRPPIFTVVSITLDNALDLMLVIDPRVVQEIEESLRGDWLWNS